MAAHRYGYARVSTLDQSTSIQREALEAAKCDRIFEENASGTTREGRSELSLVLEILREGDTLVVTRIDRLARSLKDLQDIVHDLKSRGIHLEATEQPVDTKTAAGKAFLDMLGVFAEFETNLRKERQLEGIAKAKAKGVYKGRAPLSDEKKAKVKRMYSDGIKPAQIVRETGIGKTSVFKIIKEMRENQPQK
ncbi:recombinase family protein [Pseudoalteromonas sp. MEBiC 03607]|uniref:recombinase family protein n=1 Tax=Pseudoalteromonas sp. MEBiC 03607 TaxID=2563601 RepID=UPI001093577F|nr:recombinase family protein [Pseudoalteromonas sp. MEBiC 03607]TGV20142.1 recombinase family protein [Pseudoalteromonas sp. MEBiC 03607]